MTDIHIFYMAEQLNMNLGENYKEKLQEIAEEQNRNMTQQVRHWIDQSKSNTETSPAPKGGS